MSTPKGVDARNKCGHDDCDSLRLRCIPILLHPSTLLRFGARNSRGLEILAVASRPRRVFFKPSSNKTRGPERRSASQTFLFPPCGGGRLAALQQRPCPAAGPNPATLGVRGPYFRAPVTGRRREAIEGLCRDRGQGSPPPKPGLVQPLKAAGPILPRGRLPYASRSAGYVDRTERAPTPPRFRTPLEAPLDR